MANTTALLYIHCAAGYRRKSMNIPTSATFCSNRQIGVSSASRLDSDCRVWPEFFRLNFQTSER